MSIKAMTHVWDHSTADGTELICLLALADWCNDEGFCYPGIKRLAAKCRVSERGVQKVLERLIEKGEIQIEYNQGKAVNGGNTNRYYLAKYRESIGETGGVVNVGSPGGVNGRSGGVVNVGSPKPLVYPSDKTNEAAPLPLWKQIKNAYEKWKEENEPGSSINHGETTNAAKALADKQWSPDQVIRCCDILHADSYYQQNALALWTVAKQIGAKVKRGSASSAAAPVIAPDWMTYQISEDNQWTGH